MNRKTLFAASAVVLLLAFAGGSLLYKSERIQRWAKVIGQNEAALASAHSPSLGTSTRAAAWSRTSCATDSVITRSYPASSPGAPFARAACPRRRQSSS